MRKKELGKVIYRHGLSFIVIIFLILTTAFLSTYPIKVMKALIDVAAGSSGDAVNGILNLGLMYLLLQLARSMAHSLMLHKTNLVQQQISYDIQSTLYESLLITSIEDIEKQSVTKFTNTLIEDTKYLVHNTVKPFTNILFSMTTFCMGIYFMMTIHKFLPLIILPLGGITAFVSRAIQKRSESNANEIRVSSESLWKIYAEGIKGILPIRMFKYESVYQVKVRDSLKKINALETRQSKINALSLFALSALFMFSIGSILIISGILLSKNYITMGSMTAILMYNHMIIDPLIEILDLQQNIIKSKVSFKRLLQVLDMKKDIKPRQEYENLSRIVLKDVHLYLDQTSILKDINLDIPMYSKIAIIGETGSGKSSIAKVISGIYEINQGCVLYFDGNEPSQVHPSVNFLIQEGYIFDVSIEENVRIANPDLSESDFEAIIESCALENAVKQHGNHPVGENGCAMSGGERKRVQLARVLANKNASMFIFDELTTSLDKITAKKILENVFEKVDKKMAIFIEHNTEYMDMFDYVILMKNGQVVDKGSPEILKIESDYYKRLVLSMD